MHWNLCQVFQETRIRHPENYKVRTRESKLKDSTALDAGHSSAHLPKSLSNIRVECGDEAAN